MEPLRVAAFSGARDVPSARFRVRQYIPWLRQHGIEMDEYYARLSSWPPSNKLLRPFWLAGTVLDRVPSVLNSHRYDLTFLQREMVSTLQTLEPFTKRPRVIDVDDAVWLNRRGRTGFRNIVQMCDGAICGNAFIADFTRQWHDNICLLPTAVDIDRFTPSPALQAASGRRIIGWSGLAVGLMYLYEVEKALLPVLNKHKDVVLRVVSERPPSFKYLSRSQFEYVPWSPANEVRAVQEMTIGLMPVEDTPWGMGKCSYKMLLYMACAVPVVVSPIGMNAEVLALGNLGFGPKSPTEWTEMVEWLLQNPDQAQSMGRTGREVVEQHYSLRVHAPRMASFLRNTARPSGGS